jgi:hypothetical protein
MVNTKTKTMNQVAKMIALLAPTLTRIKLTVNFAFKANTKIKTINQVAKTIALLASTLTPTRLTV